ncbi:cDNA sequence BC010787, isoform CRA_b [Mus musculus]|nr:cDNA sequence BC010787, isoform CRA_b [Mus musculus]
MEKGEDPGSLIKVIHLLVLSGAWGMQASCFFGASRGTHLDWCRARSSQSIFTSPWAVPSSTSASWHHSEPGFTSHCGKSVSFPCCF